MYCVRQRMLDAHCAEARMQLLETLSAGAPTPLAALFMGELKASVVAAWPRADSAVFLGPRMTAMLSRALDAAAAAGVCRILLGDALELAR